MSQRITPAAESQNRILYRPKEAAEMLGLKKSRFYELVAGGHIQKTHLPAKFPGARQAAKYHRDDLEEFAQRLRQTDLTGEK